MGVESGLNVANVTETINSLKINHQVIAGMRAGAWACIPLAKGENAPGKLHLQPGIFYATEGYKTVRANATDRVNVNTLQVPAWINLKFGNVTCSHFYAGLGPVFILRLSGKFTPDAGSTTHSSDVHFGSAATELKRYDIAAGVNAGYELKNGLFVRLAWQYGLVNASNVKTTVSTNGIEAQAAHAYSYSLSFGCSFGGKRR